MFGLRLVFHWTGAALAAAVVTFPFQVRALRLALEAIDPGLHRAAQSLGLSPWARFRRVTLPLALPGLLAGAITAFAAALGEFGAIMTFAANIPGETQTLPLAIYSALQTPGGETAAGRLVALAIALALTGLWGRGRRPPVTRADGANPWEPPLMLRFSLSLTKGAFALRAEAPEPCQRLALMGPSGVGKSMLLSALAGFESGAQGAVHLGVRILAAGKKELAPEGRQLGMMFQRPLLFPHLTAEENLRFARPPVPPPVSLEEVVTRLDLAPVLHRRAHQLSGGEAQRVALGRALLAAPAWLLLDEPFANLDPVRREAALVLIDEVVEREGLTLVLATHRLEEAVSLCDHLLPLVEEDGVSTGTAQPSRKSSANRGHQPWSAERFGKPQARWRFAIGTNAEGWPRPGGGPQPAAALIDREDGAPRPRARRHPGMPPL